MGQVDEMVGGHELEMKMKNRDALTGTSNQALLGLLCRQAVLTGVLQVSAGDADLCPDTFLKEQLKINHALGIYTKEK